MGHVYITYALDDADDVGRLGQALRGEGFNVQFGALTEPGVDYETQVARAIAQSRAVVAVWSSHSVMSGRVRTDAHRAQDAGRLISLRLDAAAPPILGARVVDASGAEGVMDPMVLGQLVTAIRGLAPVAGSEVSEPLIAYGAAASDSVRRRTSLARIGAMVAGGLLTGGISAVVVMSAFSGPVTTAPPVAPASRGAETAVAGLAPAGEPAPAGAPAPGAAEGWQAVPKDDPLAIRGFLLAFPDGPHVAEAQAILVALETATWQGVVAAQDAETTLTRLAAFRIAFPDARAVEALRLETEQQARIREAQGLLRAAGYPIMEATGAIDEPTRTAIARARQDLLLAPGTAIDAALLGALRGGKARAPDLPASSTPASTLPRFGEVFRDCELCPELVLIPPGRFRMGDITGASADDERPAHDVTIDYTLAVGRFEVTVAEWDACAGEGGCRNRPNGTGGQARLPMVNISPADAAEYLGWLSRKTGQAYRLLSEAEWEYAARAGTASAWSFGNQPAALCAFGNGADAASAYDWKNSCNDGYAAVAPVGMFRPNAFGLHDMIGNVWEWTADCWHATYDGAPADGRAWTAGCHADEGVLRGGAYSVDVDKLRSSYRYHFAPRRMPFFGFRVARRAD